MWSQSVDVVSSICEYVGGEAMVQVYGLHASIDPCGNGPKFNIVHNYSSKNTQSSNANMQSKSSGFRKFW